MGALIRVLLTAALVLILPKMSGAGPLPTDNPNNGILAGQVLLGGAAMAEGIVAFFDVAGGPPPNLGSARRIPDRVERVDAEGKFSVQLPRGQYYLGALLRAKGDGPGPPRPGEKFFFAQESGGKLRVIGVEAGVSKDLGAVIGTPPESFPEINEYFTIRGKVVDENGNPPAGAAILVKTDPKTPRPAYVSPETAADGTYELRLSPGTYYLLAREKLGVGRPMPGSRIGQYGDVEAKPVTGKQGEVLENIDIKLAKVPNPGEAKEKAQAEQTANEVWQPAPPPVTLPGPRPENIGPGPGKEIAGPGPQRDNSGAASPALNPGAGPAFP